MSYSEYVNCMFLVPISVYFVWLIFYGFLNFVWAAEKIKKKNYDNLYFYFRTKDGATRFLDFAG
jgi:nitrogen fixation-related uncharacterized protein